MGCGKWRHAVLSLNPRMEYYEVKILDFMKLKSAPTDGFTGLIPGSSKVSLFVRMMF